MKQAYRSNLRKLHVDGEFTILSLLVRHRYARNRTSFDHRRKQITPVGKLWISEKFKSERDERYLFSTKSNKALISFVWPLAREEFNNVPSAFHFAWRTESRINDAHHCAEKYLRGNAILLIIRWRRII